MNEDIFLSVVAPVYNEQDNIESVIVYWKKVLDSADFVSEIVVTNDGSKDKTSEILDKLERQITSLKVVIHERNYGYGRALSTAVKNARGKWIVTIDSDGQFDLRDYEVLLKRAIAENLDGVTGYRMKKKDTLFRVFADRALNIIVRVMFNLKFRDTNCALKVVKHSFLRLVEIEARGYPAPTEIIVKLSRLGAKLGESVVTHTEREAGLSKLKPIQTSINFMKFLIYLKFKISLYNKKIIHTL